jgi:hypothetical protein
MGSVDLSRIGSTSRRSEARRPQKPELEGRVAGRL